MDRIWKSQTIFWLFNSDIRPKKVSFAEAFETGFTVTTEQIDDIDPFKTKIYIFDGLVSTNFVKIEKLALNMPKYV